MLCLGWFLVGWRFRIPGVLEFQTILYLHGAGSDRFSLGNGTRLRVAVIHHKRVSNPARCHDHLDRFLAGGIKGWLAGGVGNNDSIQFHEFIYVGGEVW
ncbi:MAG: hypothetical protein ACTSUE_15110 [Promethearchaeota archaeon]